MRENNYYYWSIVKKYRHLTYTSSNLKRFYLLHSSFSSCHFALIWAMLTRVLCSRIEWDDFWYRSTVHVIAHSDLDDFALPIKRSSSTTADTFSSSTYVRSSFVILSDVYSTVYWVLVLFFLKKHSSPARETIAICIRSSSHARSLSFNNVRSRAFVYSKKSLVEHSSAKV